MPPSRAVTPWYLDKALYVTVLSLLLPLVGPRLGLDLDPMKVASALLVAVAYVAGHKWKSGKVLVAELELEAKQAAQKAWGVEYANSGLTGAALSAIEKAAHAEPAPAIASLAPLKALLVLAALAVALPAPARAAGFDWSTGPTLPFLEYDFGNPHPVQVAPGAGVQVSVTHDALKRELGGRAWDLLDVNLAAFGSVVSSSSGAQFGALSAAASACTMSSLLCVGVGKHLLGADQSFTKGGWFMLLSFSVNFALEPVAPPVGIASGPAGLLRANTLYFGGR